MYCPKCAQPQISDETQFCSRYGLPLNSLKEMMSADGKAKVTQSKVTEDKLSSRQKGVRQGVMLLVLSLILVPAYILLAALFPANDRLVESAVSDTPFEKISQAVLLTIFMLGLVRLLYAGFFQPGARFEEGEPEVVQLGSSSSNYALPPAQGMPVSGFGAWRAQTGEMVQISGSLNKTTKSLDKE